MKQAKVDKRVIFACMGTLGVLNAGCTHTVRVEAPDEPITINLNVKIDQEVRVRLEDDIEDMIQDNPDIF